jgi:hypothetical protein
VVVVAPRARLSWRRTRSAAAHCGSGTAELVGGALTSFPWFIARFSNIVGVFVLDGI